MPRYFEEYTCGCVSNNAKTRSDLLGYCAVHGNDRRKVFIDAKASKATPRKDAEASGPPLRRKAYVNPFRVKF